MTETPPPSVPEPTQSPPVPTPTKRRSSLRPDLGRLCDLATITLVNLAVLGLLVRRLRDPRDTALRIDPPPAPTAVHLAVHVTGAVRRPAVVQLPAGARVADAISAAGGPADDASPTLNLAAPLSDGDQVTVPRVGEPAAAAPVRAADPVRAAGAPAAAGVPSAAGSAAPIDLNRATAADLDALPGVGPAVAARIIAYRTANGPFRSAEELLSVSGIGERTLERLRPGVVVR